MFGLLNATLPTGAKHYFRGFLRIYDFLILKFHNNFVWRCPTKTVLLPFFCANAGERHMDVGVGTGYYPAALHQSNPSWPQHLTLVDVNHNCLESSAERIGLPDRTSRVIANALEPFTLPANEPEKFDSISLIFLLHCLPCSPAEKTQIFTNLKQHLSPQGTLFGATVLAKGVQQTWLSCFMLWFLNLIGAFSNTEDGKDDFLKALAAEFGDVEGHVIGSVFIFCARRPKPLKQT